MSERTSVFLARVGAFAIGTALFMLLTLALPWLWAPVTNRLTDGAERVWFFAWGFWAALPKRPDAANTNSVCNGVEPLDFK